MTTMMMMLKNGDLGCESGKRVQQHLLGFPIKPDDQRQDQDDHDDHDDHDKDDDNDDQLLHGVLIKPDYDFDCHDQEYYHHDYHDDNYNDYDAKDWRSGLLIVENIFSEFQSNLKMIVIIMIMIMIPKSGDLNNKIMMINIIIIVIMISLTLQASNVQGSSTPLCGTRMKKKNPQGQVQVS